jgi:hypothetical protein
VTDNILLALYFIVIDNQISFFVDRQVVQSFIFISNVTKSFVSQYQLSIIDY